MRFWRRWLCRRRRVGALDVASVELHLGKPQSAPGEGVTLAPGESAAFDFQLPPELQALAAAGVRLTFEQGPAVHEGGGRWHRDIVLFADGKKHGTLRMGWQEKR